MSKIGEGAHPLPKKPDLEKDMKKSIAHFRKHLEDFKKADSERQKAVAKDRMANELALMDLATTGMKKKDFKKQEGQLSKDFNVFQDHSTPDTIGVVEEDLNALKESLDD